MAEKNGKRKAKSGMDLGKVLLWGAVLVEAPRWAGAMLAADVSTVPDWLSVLLNVLNTISGVFMGVIIVVATAYLLDALRSAKPTVMVRRQVKKKSQVVERANWRFWGLVVFAGGLLALTPFVLGPYIVSRMTGDTIATIIAQPFWRYAWAIAVVLAPAFVVGGVAFAQPGLVKLSENAPKVAEGASESKPKAPKQPETFGKWKHWSKVPLEEREKIAGMTDVALVQKTYGVIERTAYNWMENARTAGYGQQGG